MTDSRYDFPRLPDLAGERDVERVNSKVNDGPVSADIEDRIVLRRVDILDRDRGSELIYDRLVLQELLRLVVCEHFHRVLIDWRVRACGCGEVDIESSVGKGVVGVRGFGEIPALSSTRQGTGKS